MDKLETLKKDLQSCIYDFEESPFVLKLPAAPLDNYPNLRKWLLSLGGKYKRSTFTFEHPPKQEFNTLLNGGEAVNPKKQFQFFPTPPEVADYMWQMLEMDLADYINAGDKTEISILEPSAGRGNLIAEIGRCIPESIYQHWYFCEVQPHLSREIVDSLIVVETHQVFFTMFYDFMDLPEDNQYDFIVANPPFSKSQDVKHTLKMIRHLKPGGTLVTVLPMGVTFKTNKLYKELRKIVLGDEKEIYNIPKDGVIAPSLDTTIMNLPSGSFKESGTQIDTIILKYTKPY